MNDDVIIDVVGTSGETRLDCELSKCFSANSSQLTIRPRCRSPRHVHINHLILGVLATRHCHGEYNSCCIDQEKDSLYSYRRQEQPLINVTERCNGRRQCTVQIQRATVNSQSQQLSANYVIVVFNCITNDSSTCCTPAHHSIKPLGLLQLKRDIHSKTNLL